jgi:transposase-like protein
MAEKVAVMGLLDRHGRGGVSQVRLEVVAGRKRRHFAPVVEKHVAPGSTVHTDSHPSYGQLGSDYVHNVIDHAEAYVDGNVHTNGCENFWSLLKRAIKGTYVSIEPFHLFRYLDEQSFRFNERHGNDAERFALALKGIIGKRLTYVGLTGSELPQTC